MTNIITADLVEAYSLCPRKAFLLMTGATPSPGPHGYESVVREQAEANRQAHRVRVAEAATVTSFQGTDDLASGQGALADADMAVGDLQTRCDFLIKVEEVSRSGRHSHEPV